MADKICPDCAGKKGKWRHTHSALNPAYPHIFIDCETCHEKGTVPEDKIRQAYIDSDIIDSDEDNPYIIFIAGWTAGENTWKKNYAELYEFMIAKDLVKEFMNKEGK